MSDQPRRKTVDEFVAELRAYDAHLDAEKARIARIIRASKQSETSRRRTRKHTNV